MSPEESASNGSGPQTGAERYAAARERSEAKNQAVRDELEPLAPGERPLAVTVASIVAMLFAIGNLVALLLTSDSSDGDQTRILTQSVLFFAILLIASLGMWRVKYWAVIGFQTILGLQIIVFSLSLTVVDKVGVALLYFAIIVFSGVLFWFLIRAMARIQMPDSPSLKTLQQQREEAEAAAEGARTDEQVGNDS